MTDSDQNAANFSRGAMRSSHTSLELRGRGLGPGYEDRSPLSANSPSTERPHSFFNLLIEYACGR